MLASNIIFDCKLKSVAFEGPMVRAEGLCTYIDGQLPLNPH